MPLNTFNEDFNALLTGAVPAADGWGVRWTDVGVSLAFPGWAAVEAAPVNGTTAIKYDGSVTVALARTTVLDGCNGDVELEGTFRVTGAFTVTQFRHQGRVPVGFLDNGTGSVDGMGIRFDLTSSTSKTVRLISKVNNASNLLATLTGDHFALDVNYHYLCTLTGAAQQAEVVMAAYVDRSTDGFYLHPDGVWRAERLPCLEHTATTASGTAIYGQGYEALIITSSALGQTFYLDNVNWIAVPKMLVEPSTIPANVTLYPLCVTPIGFEFTPGNPVTPTLEASSADIEIVSQRNPTTDLAILYVNSGAADAVVSITQPDEELSDTVTVSTGMVYFPADSDEVEKSQHNWRDLPGGRASTAAGAHLTAAFNVVTGGALRAVCDPSPAAEEEVADNKYPSIKAVVDALTPVHVQTTKTSPVVSLGTLTAGTRVLRTVLQTKDNVAGVYEPSPIAPECPPSSLFIRGWDLVGAASLITVPSDTRWKAWPDLLLGLGDSTAQGASAQTGAIAFASDDAWNNWLYFLSEALECVDCRRGYGSWGYGLGSLGGMPAASTGWSQLWSGQSLLTGGLLLPKPKHVVLAFGTANGTHDTADATVQADALALCNSVRAACPNDPAYPDQHTWIWVVLPEGRQKVTPITAAVTAYLTAQFDPKLWLLEHDARFSLGLTSTSYGAGINGPDGIHYSLFENSIRAAWLAGEMKRIMALVENGIYTGLAPASGSAFPQITSTRPVLRGVGRL